MNFNTLLLILVMWFLVYIDDKISTQDNKPIECVVTLQKSDIETHEWKGTIK